MTSFTMPEEVLGIPLWVPEEYDYFDIESGTMPNGDDCLVVRGDLSDTHKALMVAPTMTKDICNLGDTYVGQEWSMSFWMKHSNMTAFSGVPIILGCSAFEASNPFNGTSNAGFPFVLGMASASNIRFKREPLNNIASPPGPKILQVDIDLTSRQDYWFLYVVTEITAGSPTPTGCTMNAYIDNYLSAIVSDTAGAGPSGTMLPRKYMHLGAYHNGGLGRNDEYRIAKLAFHDHVLTYADRCAMWEAMYGSGPITFADDFNRATLGTNWMAAVSNTAADITSNELVATANTFRAMTWVRPLRSQNHYAKASVVSHAGLSAYLIVRCTPPQSTNLEWYAGGRNNANNRWELFRRNTSVATSAVAAPSYPYTLQLEALTNGSGNVELTLKANGSTVLTYTDTDPTRILEGITAGVYPRGNTSTTTIMDNFECGTL